MISKSGARVPALLLFALVAACETPVATKEAAEPFQVAVPLVTNAAYEREYVGEIQATQRVELRARTKGIVESLDVDEGQRVRAGQKLYTIGARELDQELQEARAVTESAVAEQTAARIDHAATKMLFDGNIIAENELALSASKLKVLHAKVAEARAAQSRSATNLTYARVVAPFEGIVNRLPRKVGSIVGEGELLTTLTNTDEVFVYFRMSEKEYLEYTALLPDARPKEVSLRLANGQMYPRTGIIETVENEFDRDTGNIAFRARFPNHEGLLKHASTGSVILRSELKDSVVIPQASTFEVQDQLYVYAVHDDNTVRLRRVVPRARLKDTFVLESGLAPDDRFVTEGVQKLRDGAKIAVRAGGPTQSAI